MTTEEQLARIIEQNERNQESADAHADRHAAQIAKEFALAEEHRAYMRRECPTLRDDFAKAALTGLLAQGSSRTEDQIVAAAYKVADAMLEERAK